MELVSWFSLLLLVILVIATCYLFSSPPSVPAGLKQLPGPKGVPLLGYIPFLGKQPYKTFSELGKKYGALFQVPMGQRTVVVLNSRDVIVEALVQDNAFSGRPNIPMMRAFAEAGPSRFFLRTGDKRWKFLRKNAVKALALFGSSKNSKLEKLVHECAENLNNDFLSTEGRPVDPQKTIFECTSTVIGSINFGGQFNRNDPWLKEVVHLAGKVGQALALGNLVDFLPFGSILFRHKIKQFIKDTEPLVQVTEKHIETHQCNEQVTDIADALSKVAAELTDEELADIGISRKAIRYISQDLFGAGFATIMESFRWCLNILVVEQHAQKRVQEELDRVLEGRSPTLNDRNLLPYTEATLLEAFRFSSLIPLLIPHSAMEDTKLDSYFIPKDSIVVANMWGLHNNEDLFPEPARFRPERFLTEDGTELQSDAAQVILPFGCGKRRCVGENLARQELFLLLSSVLQKFKIDPAPGVTIDLTLAKPGFNRRPYEYKLVFTKR